jgi:hypothetical protein
VKLEGNVAAPQALPSRDPASITPHGVDADRVGPGRRPSHRVRVMSEQRYKHVSGTLKAGRTAHLMPARSMQRHQLKRGKSAC